MTEKSIHPIPPPEPEHAVGSTPSEPQSTVEAVRDQAAQTAEVVKDKAQQIGTQAAEKADAATTAVGEKMSDVAQTIREKAPESGPVAQAADTTAQTLERAGSYLREQDLAEMQADVEELIRRYPVQALLIGFGVGYLLGRSTRR